jgi:ammonia channel protein AmtB
MKINKTSKTYDIMWVVMSILLSCVLFYPMARVLWDGDKMVAELKSDCNKRGGIVIEHQKTFGTDYSCKSYLGK